MNFLTHPSTSRLFRTRWPTILSGARERSRTMRATIGYQARCLSGTANAITCGSKWPQMHATSAGRRVTPTWSAHEVCTFRAHALAFAMTSIVSPLRHRPDAQLAVHVPQRLQGVQHMPEPIVRPPHVETTLSSVLNSRLPRPFGSTTEAEFERRMAEFQPKNAVITPKDFYR